jgi:hypothetical protein
MYLQWLDNSTVCGMTNCPPRSKSSILLERYALNLACKCYYRAIIYYLCYNRALPKQARFVIRTVATLYVGTISTRAMCAMSDGNPLAGCLFTWPGSHKSGVHRRFKRRSEDDSVYFDAPPPEYDLSKFVALEVGVALFRSNARF